MSFLALVALLAILFIWPDAVPGVVWQIRGGAALLWEWAKALVGKKSA